MAPARAVLALAAGLCAAAAGPLPAQESTTPEACPAGRISNIFIDNHSIFDVDDLEEGNKLRWAYRLANALHVRTRQSFIRRELLVEEGDCLDPLLLNESGRILRRYGFIAHADVFAVAQADGTHHVVVDTQDEWTTKVDLGVSVDDGLRIEGLDLTEENLLGQGILAAVFLRQRRERRDVGARVEFPRLFGSRMDWQVGAGRTRVGSFIQEQLAYPFVGEVGRVALRQVYRRRDEIFPYSTGGAEDFSHVLLPLLDERVELSVAGRLGRPGNLTLFGLGISRETLEFGGFPQDLEIARDNDFGNPEPAPASAAALVERQTRPASTTRLNLLVGQRNLRFVRVRGLDPLDGEQDVELGTEIGLTLGRSVDVLSAEGLEPTDDLYTRLRIFAGHDPGTSYVFANLALEGRNLLSGDAGDGGWRDVIAELDLYGYVRSRRMPGHTFFGRISAGGGWSLDTPFQLTLGGRSGVRGFHQEDYPGAKRILLSLEDRIFLGWPMPDLFDFGLSLFADAGRVWKGAVPYGADSDWKGTLGFGLRFGFPKGSRGVARLDLGFPLGGGNRAGPVFRVTLYETLGLNTGFEDAQMRRSRRIAIGPDFFVQENR